MQPFFTFLRFFLNGTQVHNIKKTKNYAKNGKQKEKTSLTINNYFCTIIN